jgi:hypothetical protein
MEKQTTIAQMQTPAQTSYQYEVQYIDLRSSCALGSPLPALDAHKDTLSIAYSHRLALQARDVPDDQRRELSAILQHCVSFVRDHKVEVPKELTTQPVSIPLLNGLISRPLPAGRTVSTARDGGTLTPDSPA